MCLTRHAVLITDSANNSRKHYKRKKYDIRSTVLLMTQLVIDSNMASSTNLTADLRLHQEGRFAARQL